MLTTTREDIEHAIVEHRATLARLEADRRTEAQLIASVRERIDVLLEEWTACPER